MIAALLNLHQRGFLQEVSLLITASLWLETNLQQNSHHVDSFSTDILSSWDIIKLTIRMEHAVQHISTQMSENSLRSRGVKASYWIGFVFDCGLLQVSPDQLFYNLPSILQAHQLFWQEVVYPMVQEVRQTGKPFDPMGLEEGCLQVWTNSLQVTVNTCTLWSFSTSTQLTIHTELPGLDFSLCSKFPARKSQKSKFKYKNVLELYVEDLNKYKVCVFKIIVKCCITEMQKCTFWATRVCLNVAIKLH